VFTKLGAACFMMLAAITYSSTVPTLDHPFHDARAQQVLAAQRGRGDGVPGSEDPRNATVELDDKQKTQLLHENLEKSRKDSEELANLAHQLQKDLEKPGSDAFTPDCALRLDRIEKLAKKIRGELKDY
jgi:hypothetical protein